MMTTSLTLLERLRQESDLAAWPRFVDLYTPLLFHWARRSGLQDQDAADLVQEVFLLLLDKFHKFTYDPQKKFRAWLRVVAQRKWQESYRRKVPIPIGSGEDTPHLSNLEEKGADLFWETEYRQHLSLRALTLMKNSFEETTWQACWSVVVLGKSVAEVAAELGLSPGAVYVAKSRVLKQLRTELEGLLD
jgi:RNA polymerase sigma-70 factor (ECF subfamily)